MHPKRKQNPEAKRPKAKNKDNDALVQAAWDAGWWCQMSKKGYIHCKSPDGKGMVVIESTPSDHHSTRNSRARLRNLGLSV
jgi:hypothetical protein